MKSEPTRKGSSTWILLLGAVIIVLIVIVVVAFASNPSPSVNNQTPIASPEIGGTQVPDQEGPATDVDTGDDTAEEAEQVEEAVGNDSEATEEGVISPANSG